MNKKRLMLDKDIMVNRNNKFKKLSFDFGYLSSKILITKPISQRTPPINYLNPSKKLQLNPSSVSLVTFEVTIANQKTIVTKCNLNSINDKLKSKEIQVNIKQNKVIKHYNTISNTNNNQTIHNRQLNEEKVNCDNKETKTINYENERSVIEINSMKENNKNTNENNGNPFNDNDNDDYAKDNNKSEVIHEEVEKIANENKDHTQNEIIEISNESELSKLNELEMSENSHILLSDFTESMKFHNSDEVIDLISSPISLQSIKKNINVTDLNLTATNNNQQSIIKDSSLIEDNSESSDSEVNEKRLPSSRLNSNESILTYTYQIANTINLLWKDYYSLNPQAYINDIIINFYLRFIEDNFNQTTTDKILIMNSYFYTLISKDDKGNMNEMLKSFSFKKKYCRGDIFSNDYIIAPIYEHLHWSLAIIVSPYKIVNLNKNKTSNNSSCSTFTSTDIDGNKDDYPFIIYLDSYFDSNKKCIKIFKKYLCCEYIRTSNSNSIEDTLQLQSKSNLITSVTPKMPKQPNAFDCGIYLLAYCELFLYNPNYFIDKIKLNAIDMENCFDDKYTNCKRKEIQRLIKKLKLEHNKSESVGKEIKKYIIELQKRIKKIMSK